MRGQNVRCLVYFPVLLLPHPVEHWKDHTNSRLRKRCACHGGHSTRSRRRGEASLDAGRASPAQACAPLPHPIPNPTTAPGASQMPLILKRHTHVPEPDRRLASAAGKRIFFFALIYL